MKNIIITDAQYEILKEEIDYYWETDKSDIEVWAARIHALIQMAINGRVDSTDVAKEIVKFQTEPIKEEEGDGWNTWEIERNKNESGYSN